MSHLRIQSAYWSFMSNDAAVGQAQGPHSLCEIFVDESSQTKHRYLVLGGLIVPAHRVSELEARIAEARLPELPAGELAWTKVSRSKLEAYKRVATVALSASDIGPVQFHSLVVDTHRIRDNVFNAGSREVGFNKEIYQLLQKFGRLHRAPNFHVYLDRRNTSSSTTELRDILNMGIRKRQPNRDWPFRRVHFRDSDRTPCLQVVDILLGAVAFFANGHRRAEGASPAKCELADYIMARAGVRDPLRDTATAGKFTIWYRQLR